MKPEIAKILSTYIITSQKQSRKGKISTINSILNLSHNWPNLTEVEQTEIAAVALSILQLEPGFILDCQINRCLEFQGFQYTKSDGTSGKVKLLDNIKK